MNGPDLRGVVSKAGLSSAPGRVHPVLLDQPGVAQAVRAVEDAKGALSRIREERRAAHLKWQAAVAKAVGRPEAERPVEPPRGVSHDERVELDARARLAEVELGAVLASVSGEVLASASEREVAILEEVRTHVEALMALADEVKLLGRAVNIALRVEGRGGRRQPLPSLDDLVWLVGKGDDVALFDFADPGDKRTRWLQETHRART